jgi:hypothetical protein
MSITYPTDFKQYEGLKVDAAETTDAVFDPAQFGIAKDQQWRQELDGYTRTWTVIATRPGRVQMRLTGLAVKNVNAVIPDAEGSGIRVKAICPFLLAFTYKKVS